MQEDYCIATAQKISAGLSAQEISQPASPGIVANDTA